MKRIFDSTFYYCYSLSANYAARSLCPIMQATRTAPDNSNLRTITQPNLSDVQTDCTKPERPIRIYSYWGSPLDNVGEDGDYVFEEISGSLIGPKENGKWPETFIKIEGPVVSKRGFFPRWRNPAKPIARRRCFILIWLKSILRVLLRIHTRDS